MDENETPSGDIELDPILQQKFADLTNGEAPDTWASVQHPPIAPPAVVAPLSVDGNDAADIVVLDRVQNTPNPLLRAAAAVLLLIGLGVWARSLVGDSDEGQIEIAEGAEFTTSTVPTSEEIPCVLGDLQSRLEAGMPIIDYEPTASLGHLVARSEERVFGRLVSTRGYGGGTILTLEDPSVQQVWIPSRVPDGQLSGSAVALLSQEQVPGPLGKLRVVLPEGLWVACGPEQRTLPALMAPTEPGWRNAALQTLTLNRLWEMAAIAELTEIGSATHQDDQVAVYRVDWSGISFRLSLPLALADDEITFAPVGESFQFSGPSFEATLSLRSSCGEAERTGARPNLLGSIVTLDEGGATACRPMESLKLEIEADGLDSQDLDAFDIRFLDHGEFGPFGEYGPGIPEAGPWAVGSFVTRVGDSALVGLNPDTLEEMWRFDSDSTQLWPTMKQSALLVGEGSNLIRLDADDGSVLWTAAFPEDGPVQYLLDSWDGKVLRFAAGERGGSDQTSALEKINVSTGEVLWRATGRAGGEWSTTVPIQTRSVILTGERLLSDQSDGFVTYAIDDANGELLWVADFEMGASIEARGGMPTIATTRWVGGCFCYEHLGAFASYIVLRGQAALIMRTVDQGVVRVDPQTGEILWSVVVQWGPILGKQMSADGATIGVAIATPDGKVLLDPFTGERLPL